MGLLGNLNVNIGADTTGFQKGLKSVSSGLSQLKSNLASIAKAGLAFAGVTAGIKAAYDSLKAYTGLESNLLRVNGLFGDAAKYVSYFAENTGKAFGIAETSAYQYAATYGNLFKNITSSAAENAKVTIAMMKASAVVASKTGRTMEDVMERIRSGLLGNTEAIEDLGINVNVAMLESTDAFKRIADGRSWDKLTFYEQQQVRTLAILEQAHKNFGDEVQQGSAYSLSVLSASFKDLQAAAGAFVNAGLKPVISALTQLVQWAAAGLKALASLLGLQVSTASAAAETTDAVSGESGAVSDLADETEAAGKAAKGTTASFDQFNDITQKSASSSGSAGGSSGAASSVFSSIAEPEYGQTAAETPIETTVKNIQAALGPAKEALDRFWEALQPLKDFTFSALSDFYNNLLVPLGKWVLGEGFPRFVDALSKGISSVNWANILNGLNELWGALQPFAQNVGEGLLWLWENVFVPFGAWVANDAAPAFLNLLAGALDTVNAAIDALKPLGQWLWDNILQPQAEWARGVFVDVLNAIADALARVGDWIRGNQKAVETIAVVVGSFAAAWGLLNAAVGLWNAIGVVATAVTTAFGAAVTFLTSPIGIVTVAIGALIAIIVLLAKNWDAVKETASKVWEWIQNVWNSFATWFDTNVWSPFKEALKSVGNFFIRVWNGIVSAFESAINWIIDGINTFISGLNWLLGGASDLLGAVGIKVNLQISPISKVHFGRIPELASGGVVYGEVAALVGDNFNAAQDPEVVAPLSSLRNMILEAMLQRDIAVGSDREMRITMTLESGEVLCDMLVDPMNRTAKNLGYAPVFRPA